MHCCKKVITVVCTWNDTKGRKALQSTQSEICYSTPEHSLLQSRVRGLNYAKNMTEVENVKFIRTFSDVRVVKQPDTTCGPRFLSLREQP